MNTQSGKSGEQHRNPSENTVALGPTAGMAIQRRSVFAWAIFAGISFAAMSGPAVAWNEEGHRIVALVADHYLDPAARQQIEAILATDSDSRTKHDIASEATWADLPAIGKSENDQPPSAAKSWHYTRVELDHPAIAAACPNHGPLAVGALASQGPEDCSLNKVYQFAGELAAAATPPAERLLALKYLLNLVADLHEPLFASDNHDESGETVRVSAGGSDPGTLRHYWDSEFIDYLGDDAKAVADDLADGVRQSKTYEKMSGGTPRDWALETFLLAKDHAYGKLPPKKTDGSYELPPDYVTEGIETVRLQLARAGVRLAKTLNHALSKG